MLQFKSKTHGGSIHFYERSGQWFFKKTRKGGHIKMATENGPFKDQGTALLSVCMDQSIGFSDYAQIYPRGANGKI